MGNLAEVKIREIDLSLVSNPTTGSVIALFIGSAERGPANTMMFITNSMDLQKTFGISSEYDTFDANLYMSYAGSPIFFIRSVSPILEKDIPNAFKNDETSPSNPDMSIDWTLFKDISNGYYFTNIHKKFVTFPFFTKDDISDDTVLQKLTINTKLVIFDKDLYPSLYSSIDSIKKALIDYTSTQNSAYLNIIKNTINSYEGNMGFWAINLTIVIDSSATSTTYTFDTTAENYPDYFVFTDVTHSSAEDLSTIINNLITTLYLDTPTLVEQLFKYGHLIKVTGALAGTDFTPDLTTTGDKTRNILEIDTTDWSIYVDNGSDSTTLDNMPITDSIFDNTQNIANENYIIDFILTPSVYINSDTLEIFAPISITINSKPTMTYLFGIDADTTEDVTSIVEKVQNVPGFPADDLASYYATIYPNIYYSGRKVNASTALAIMYAKKGAGDFYQPAANTTRGSIVFATGTERLLFRNEADTLYTDANINPIITKNGNPAVIWGNRTLYLGGTGTSSARSMLSFRLVLNRYKIELQNLLSQYLFTVGDFNEIFNSIAFNIDNINNRYVGKGFRSVSVSNLTTADEETNHILHIQLEVTPNYSVEKIYVDVVISNAGITMTENG